MLISLSPLFWSAKLRSQNLMSRYEGRSDVEKWIPCRWHHFAGKTHMKRTKLGCVKKLCVSEISTELKKKTEPKSGCGVKGLEQKTGIIKLHQISWFNFITYIFQYTINIHQRGISWNIMEYSPRSTHWLRICKTCSNHLLIGDAGSFLSPRHAFLSQVPTSHAWLTCTLCSPICKIQQKSWIWTMGCKLGWV